MQRTKLVSGQHKLTTWQTFYYDSEKAQSIPKKVTRTDIEVIMPKSPRASIKSLINYLDVFIIYIKGITRLGSAQHAARS